MFNINAHEPPSPIKKLIVYDMADSIREHIAKEQVPSKVLVARNH